jgi:hypothetical protein
VCLSFCGTTKKPRSLEPGGGWDLSFIYPCTHFLCFVPLHTLLMFRPLAHTSYVSFPPVLSSPTIKCKRKDGSPCHPTNLSRSQ